MAIIDNQDLNITSYEKALLDSFGIELKPVYAVPDLVAVTDESGNVTARRLGPSKRSVQRLLDFGVEKVSKPTTRMLKAGKNGKFAFVLLPNLLLYLKGENQFDMPSELQIQEMLNTLISKNINPTEFITELRDNPDPYITQFKSIR